MFRTKSTFCCVFLKIFQAQTKCRTRWPPRQCHSWCSYRNILRTWWYCLWGQIVELVKDLMSHLLRGWNYLGGDSISVPTRWSYTETVFSWLSFLKFGPHAVEPHCLCLVDHVCASGSGCKSIPHRCDSNSFETAIVWSVSHIVFCFGKLDKDNNTRISTMNPSYLATNECSSLMRAIASARLNWRNKHRIVFLCRAHSSSVGAIAGRRIRSSDTFGVTCVHSDGRISA